MNYWKSGREVEGSGFENRRRRPTSEGSNPSSSVLREAAYQGAIEGMQLRMGRVIALARSLGVVNEDIYKGILGVLQKDMAVQGFTGKQIWYDDEGVPR